MQFMLPSPTEPGSTLVMCAHLVPRKIKGIRFSFQCSILYLLWARDTYAASYPDQPNDPGQFFKSQQ